MCFCRIEIGKALRGFARHLSVLPDLNIIIYSNSYKPKPQVWRARMNNKKRRAGSAFYFRFGYALCRYCVTLFSTAGIPRIVVIIKRGNQLDHTRQPNLTKMESVGAPVTLDKGNLGTRGVTSFGWDRHSKICTVVASRCSCSHSCVCGKKKCAFSTVLGTDIGASRMFIFNELRHELETQQSWYVLHVAAERSDNPWVGSTRCAHLRRSK